MKIKYKSKEVREGKRGKEVIGAQEEERSITYDLTRATLKLSLLPWNYASQWAVLCYGWIAALSKRCLRGVYREYEGFHYLPLPVMGLSSRLNTGGTCCQNNTQPIPI